MKLHTKINREREEEAWKKVVIRDVITLISVSAIVAMGIVFTLWAAAKGIID